MRNRAMICRALGTHALEIKPPIFVLPGGYRLVNWLCDRCGSARRDVWEKGTGKQFNRSYKKDEEYAAFIKEHNHAEARSALLGVSREVKSGKHGTHLRLLPGKQTKARRHHKAARGRSVQSA